MIQSGTETWAPSGITFMNQGPLAGKLIVACLRGQQLLAISLNENGTIVKNLEILYKNEFGRLREVVQAKDGSLYITTSNQDGRGNPNATDDKIIHLFQ